jgi:hypothetical protein
MAKLINCKACGKEISKSAKKCPHCGHDQRSFFGKHKILTGLVVLVVVIGAAGALGSKGSKDNDSKATSTSNTKKEESKKSETKVTYENYLKIAMGQKYEDVVALIGEGTEISSNEVGGIKTKIYKWNGDGVGNLTVTTQNGVVDTKAQAFLKSMDAKITLDKYNQVKEGMTYDQVKAILGDGQESTRSKIANIETVMYEWINKNGSNANFTFQGDKLNMKSQFELK